MLSSPPVALRRHRLPRFWLAFTLGPVLVLVGLVYWWERQLPARIQQAAEAGRLEDCLRYGDQLSALSWLPGGVPQEQGRCRRQRAQQLWQEERWADALKLQRQLVQSPAAGSGDRQRAWNRTEAGADHRSIQTGEGGEAGVDGPPSDGRRRGTVMAAAVHVHLLTAEHGEGDAI